MRLDKFLTECGVGTRSQVKDIIKKGEITVNGKVAKTPKEHIDEESDEVIYNGENLSFKSNRYYALYKLAGYVTALEDRRDKTVMELLPDWVNTKKLFPVGRLDKDTEGLLIFTNDGKASHEMLSPKRHVDKTYYVKLLEEIQDDKVKLLERGVDIGGYVTKPSKVQIINNTEILLTISEGRFHQVKKMMVAVDNKVEYLKRVQFGELHLGDMKPGEVREVDLADII
ncbi:pseudouridine synthase [Propionigenium maris DSM 9537]|uniref:Pseudouridine synthase n=1 Tax=Propionigenium maris DSM 9537 TaxID=1123000 RepID=A0A9W6GGK3_9FUSO|nr:pseudouridine synthase [Propionigenium maris]GLI54863.1 pseudouridine synthase [Propionigenium maris DSM 9537]